MKLISNPKIWINEPEKHKTLIKKLCVHIFSETYVKDVFYGLKWWSLYKIFGGAKSSLKPSNQVDIDDFHVSYDLSMLSSVLARWYSVEYFLKIILQSLLAGKTDIFNVY